MASQVMTAKRVLIIGSDLDETVADCYRRALTPFYEVKVCNPFDTAPGLARRLGRVPYERLNGYLKAAAHIATSEPLGHSRSRVRRALEQFGPELVLVTCIDVLPPDVVAHAHAVNREARVLGVFSDAISNFGRGYFFAAEYDALFFKDHFIVDKFRSKLGWNHAYYLPQACDPARHRPLPLAEADVRRFGCDVTLAGNAHYFRAAMLEPLMGLDFRMWGAPPPRWLKHAFFAKHTREYVVGDEKCKAMLAARIVLNANHYAEIAGTNKRTFEVAAIGAFQLTDTPALADVFVPDQEVATFDSREDMVEKVHYYLGRPEERASMAKRAQERAHREHTYLHRWAAKLAVLGIELPDGFPLKGVKLAVEAK